MLGNPGSNIALKVSLLGVIGVLKAVTFVKLTFQDLPFCAGINCISSPLAMATWFQPPNYICERVLPGSRDINIENMLNLIVLLDFNCNMKL